MDKTIKIRDEGNIVTMVRVMLP